MANRERSHSGLVRSLGKRVTGQTVRGFKSPSLLQRNKLTAISHIDKVIKYYDSTVIDYKLLWTGSKDLAIHFGYYDQETKNHYQSLLNMNAVLAGLAQISKTDRVLDAGCGYGGSAMWLAKNIGCEVSGISPVPYQIKKADHFAKKFQISDKVNFEVGDYARTSFPDNSFTVVWGLESLVHAESEKNVIQESYRLLKPGGRIVIAEYMLRENPPLSDAEKELISPWLKGWAMPNLQTPTEYKEMLLEAGFTNINFSDITENVRPSMDKLEKILWWRAFPAKIVYQLKVISPDHYGNVEASDCLIKTLKMGLWGYRVVTAEK